MTNVLAIVHTSYIYRYSVILKKVVRVGQPYSYTSLNMSSNVGGEIFTCHLSFNRHVISHSEYTQYEHEDYEQKPQDSNFLTSIEGYMETQTSSGPSEC